MSQIVILIRTKTVIYEFGGIKSDSINKLKCRLEFFPYGHPLVQDNHTPNRHCRKNLAILKVELKRKYGIKIDGQILVIYPSKILY